MRERRALIHACGHPAPHDLLVTHHADGRTEIDARDVRAAGCTDCPACAGAAVRYPWRYAEPKKGETAEFRYRPFPADTLPADREAAQKQRQRLLKYALAYLRDMRRAVEWSGARTRPEFRAEFARKLEIVGAALGEIRPAVWLAFRGADRGAFWALEIRPETRKDEEGANADR